MEEREREKETRKSHKVRERKETREGFIERREREKGRDKNRLTKGRR